jgi:hypothetical protein
VKENADGITEVEKSSYGIYVSTGTRGIWVDFSKTQVSILGNTSKPRAADVPGCDISTKGRWTSGNRGCLGLSISLQLEIPQMHLRNHLGSQAACTCR